ncbi:polyribonucleotide nucleotidyltransferase [Candidatus Velamenicoccus archaeovorus]|uniref:Polyribonucleotide nucleotidyltransferase n=1 Tax=Velamenicoccus archaeovorus TaxID=1930593 RepID=A0A410P7E2_VELA1|nr:polyribonucleotide nucleotidyltransferase [Candidatus Velamenicoccus archaeovorus]QAT18033.1 polyribonucleotide nucleotidyltransferase [Candidatus Velamenicoccus archaeovorus]
MNPKIEKVEAPFGDKNLILSTGKLAKQADGAVTVQMGDSVVLVTACVSKDIREGIDFFPLTVEYQEKTYAAGRIPGGFFKREGRPSESEILISRLIDRPVRPLFPCGFRNDVQVIALVLSSDAENDPDVLAVIGASAALGISQIPFEGPIGAVRIGRVDGKLVVNPTYAQREASDLDLVVVGNRKKVIMIEGEAKGLEEAVVYEALKFGHEQLQVSIKIQEDLIKACGREKMSYEDRAVSPELVKSIKAAYMNRVKENCKIAQKEARMEAVQMLYKDVTERFCVEKEGEDQISEKDIKAALDEIESEEIRKLALEENRRVDGRKFDEVRAISCEVGNLPRTHGSGLFTRGQTQSLAVTTLGTRADEQLIEALEGKSYKKFMLHYNFPPFSVGEVKPVRGAGRREIGHGALAEKSLKAVMPTPEEFPYTVRVVSEILESNGSSSMATVCASSLSLMDAGVPIKEPVAGIAMGLVQEDSKHLLLTDIAGLEDHHGDMDFKIAGTRKGITAIQLDLKISGIDFDIIREVLERSRTARHFILDKMTAVLEAPRKELSEYAPRIIHLKINQERIGDLIGPGGKNIRKIIELTGVAIDVEDDGSVLVASTDSAASQRAVDMIKGLTEDAEIGKIYRGKVKRIMNFGAFVEILPNKEGLCHVKELDDKYVKNVEDVVKIGDEIDVKVISIDELGRINLSKKQAKSEK